MSKTFVTGEVLTASDVNTYLVNNGYQYAGTRYYTSSGSFDKADPLGTGDIGLRAIRVTVVGGGGGGGDAETDETQGGGGGGGGYAEVFFTDIASLSSTETVSRGAGGAPENTGGTSQFGTLITGNGGAGGATDGGSLAAGGTSSGTVDFGVNGQQGGAGGLNLSGRGGDAFKFGMGGPPPLRGAGGRPGQSVGGGGSGGYQSVTTNRTGGTGANGIVIVDCYV